MDETWKTISLSWWGFGLFSGAFVCFREGSPVIGKYQAKGSGAAVVTVPTSVKSLMLRMVDTGPKLGGGRNFSKLQVGLEMIFRFSAVFRWKVGRFVVSSFQLVKFLGMSWEKLRMETELNRTSENVSPLPTGLYFKLPSCTAKELMFKLQAKGKDWLPLQKQIGPRFGWEFGMMIHESLSIAKNDEGSQTIIGC